MAEGRRPRRHCAARRTAAPSAVHYVGYVEDDETPEMIMKKFEELEKVRHAASAPDTSSSGAVGAITDGVDEAEQVAPGRAVNMAAGLSDAQLLEVFKQTSTFNVRSALAGNESLLSRTELGSERWSDGEDLDEESPWGDERGFWSDEEDADYTERRKKAAHSRTQRREGGVRAVSRSKPRHDIITTYNTTTRALVRKKVRAVDKDALVQIKIPFPLPLSWGRTVQPYVPTAAMPCERDAEEGAPAQPFCWTLEQDSVLATDWSILPKDFLGVLINPGWEELDATGPAVTGSLARLPIPRLCPIGFVFIWVRKQHISAVMRQMGKWGFGYVENLTWVFLHRNHSVQRLPSEFLRRSHLTLFLFRREGVGKDIELRHQRKADVVFDTIRSSPGQAFEVPEEVYVTIETMLPSGMNRFLELWASQGAARPGWVQVAETGSSPAKTNFVY